MLPKAILTSLSAVPHAARQERQAATEMTVTATGRGGRCSLLYVPSVAKTLKFRSSREKIDRYTVAIAIAR